MNLLAKRIRAVILSMFRQNRRLTDKQIVWLTRIAVPSAKPGQIYAARRRLTARGELRRSEVVHRGKGNHLANYWEGAHPPDAEPNKEIPF
jgi:hypothetical protein